MKTTHCSGRQRLEARATVCATSPHWVDLELAAAQPCAGCKGLCLWSLARRSTRFQVPRSTSMPPVTPGDELQLSVPADTVLVGALIAYGLPLTAMLAGALLLGVGGSDGSAVLGAGLGLLAGVPLGRRAQQSLVTRLVSEFGWDSPEATE